MRNNNTRPPGHPNIEYIRGPETLDIPESWPWWLFLVILWLIYGVMLGLFSVFNIQNSWILYITLYVFLLFVVLTLLFWRLSYFLGSVGRIIYLVAVAGLLIVSIFQLFVSSFALAIGYLLAIEFLITLFLFSNHIVYEYGYDFAWNMMLSGNPMSDYSILTMKVLRGMAEEFRDTETIRPYVESVTNAMRFIVMLLFAIYLITMSVIGANVVYDNIYHTNSPARSLLWFSFALIGIEKSGAVLFVYCAQKSRFRPLFPNRNN